MLLKKKQERKIRRKHEGAIKIIKSTDSKTITHFLLSFFVFKPCLKHAKKRWCLSRLLYLLSAQLVERKYGVAYAGAERSTSGKRKNRERGNEKAASNFRTNLRQLDNNKIRLSHPGIALVSSMHVWLQKFISVSVFNEPQTPTNSAQPPLPNIPI